eukprot:TRINITY_DN4517_c0_g1_i1.p1 TRINITY_DN4517_c0_g1~~TRINITY_DN4517_c0_g1_i1.p1  ORF type:complete len:251 (-),score=14.19 TRINITY_DN4517_c0_g1_i1:141-893(-)
MQINIEPITVHDRTFLVVRDDLVLGGSKSRALQPLIRNHPDITEYVYAGPTTGHAQIALALNCVQQGKRARIFCVGPLTPIQTFIRAQPGVTVVHREYASLKKVQRMAEEYCQNQDQSVFLVPFGFDFPEFRQLLEENIHQNMPLALRISPPRRVWVVAGSGTLLSILYKVFPTSQFGVVQVGKKVWPDQLELDRTVLYIAEEKFFEVSKQPPPYPSVATYDAKVWQFVLQHGENGDLVWNVAADLPGDS